MQSPRSANSADGNVAVTTNYDGRRLVNSPTSLEACRVEGVLPELLLLRDLQRGKLDPADDPYASCACANAEQLQVKKDFIERKRKNLVNTIRAARERIQLARKKQASSPTRLPNISSGADSPRNAATRSPGKSKPDSAAAGTSSTNADGTSSSPSPGSSPRRPRKPEGTTAPRPNAFHNVPMPPDVTEAAQLFETLRSQAAEKAGREARWQSKMERIEAQKRAASARRTEKAAAHAAAVEQKVATAQQRAQERELERQRRAEETVEREEVKLRTISAQRTERHRELRTTRVDRGRKEREEVERREEQRVEALREKLERANNASREAQDRQAKERERRAFLSELQAAAYREQTTRTHRAKEHRSLELESRLLEAQERRQEAQHDRDQHQFQKTLQREVIARQKHEIAAFMQSHGRASPDAAPPSWLEPQLRSLKEKQKAPQTARGPRPPSSVRGDAAPSRTARGNAAATRAFKVREPFTINSAATPRKQAFAPWMFQSD